MMKRVFLFLITNVLILVTISIVLNLLGVQPYLTAQGINYNSLMIFCAVWGMGGAFISLMLSKVMAKWMMKVKIIDANTRDPMAIELVQTVHRLAKAAKLSKMPEVGIYASPEVNAFATGPSKNNSLVAVSEGLLRRMDKSEVEGVLGHEIAHIANGDMVTMTLIQGVVNAFVMFFARIAAFAVANLLRGNDDREGGPSYFLQFALIFVFEILFAFLGSIVVCYFSRLREYRADKGGAMYAGREKMIRALERLKQNTELIDTEHKALATLKISNKPQGFVALFMTHPPLERRIERLKQYAM